MCWGLQSVTVVRFNLFDSGSVELELESSGRVS